MSKIVNLRTARKQARRAAQREKAAETSMRHGRSKAARLREEQEAASARAHLDAHRREP